MTRAAALTGITGISFAAILTRLAATTPVTITFFRAGIALPILAVIWWRRRHLDHRDSRARLVAFLAGLVLGVDLTSWHLSIEYIGPGPATVLANVQVVFVAILAWIAYRERPPVVTLVLLPVMLGGVALLSGLGRATTGTDPWLGVVFGLAAAFTYGSFILLLRHSNRRALAPSAGPLLDATAGVVVAAGILAWFDDGFEIAPTGDTLGWLVMLALVSQVFGWLLITHALPRLPATQVSAMILLQPALTLVWARLIFDEALSATQWAGVAVVLAGIATITLAGASPQPG